MSKNNKNTTLAFLVMASSALITSTVYANEQVNNEIKYFCSKSDINTEQTVSIGKSRQVDLNSGSFYLVESQSDFQVTLDMISGELVNMGVDPECAEYLMTHSRLQGYEQGNVMARVYFDFDKFNLTDESKYILGAVANVVKQNPSELVLEGHTDNTGSKDYNFALGLKRSEATHNYLLSRGAEGDNFAIASKGEGEPIADNKTSVGRKKNRRVDIVDESPVN
ncbi:OmpA family protein [Vibrio sp. DW001]|uniref:OmpA family protein n=1 Tax=Vibrio sp. DW001 TaxID=2912315 RepID=UPI0023B0E8EE|nr:OmpA family protein [Vibrio sp. DW001]WED26076.1 OmpA family protein [Vibrio sp. DW001]